MGGIRSKSTSLDAPVGAYFPSVASFRNAPPSVAVHFRLEGVQTFYLCGSLYGEGSRPTFSLGEQWGCEFDVVTPIVE